MPVSSRKDAQQIKNLAPLNGHIHAVVGSPAQSTAWAAGNTPNAESSHLLSPPDILVRKGGNSRFFGSGYRPFQTLNRPFRRSPAPNAKWPQRPRGFATDGVKQVPVIQSVP